MSIFPKSTGRAAVLSDDDDELDDELDEEVELTRTSLLLLRQTSFLSLLIGKSLFEDETEFDSRNQSLKDCLQRARLQDIDGVYERMLGMLPGPEVETTIEPLSSPSLGDLPSEDMKRKADSILADYHLICAKYGCDPSKPTSNLITKLLLYVESTKKWSPWSFKSVLCHLLFEVTFPNSLFLDPCTVNCSDGPSTASLPRNILALVSASLSREELR